MSNPPRRASKAHLPAGASAIWQRSRDSNPSSSWLRTTRAHPGRTAKLVLRARIRTRGLPLTGRLHCHCATRANWGGARVLAPMLRLHRATCPLVHQRHHNGVPPEYRPRPIRVCNPARSLARSRNRLAGAVGFEPTRNGLEPLMLPLHQTPKLAPFARFERAASRLTVSLPCL